MAVVMIATPIARAKNLSRCHLRGPGNELETVSNDRGRRHDCRALLIYQFSASNKSESAC